MRTMYFLTAAFLSAVIFVPATGAQPVDPQQVEREVLFMLAPDIADFDALSARVALEAAPLPPAVSGALEQQGVPVISRAIPDFRRTDTLSVTRDGHAIRFTDWTNYLVASVPPPFDPDTLVARLERLDEVLWANRNQMLVYNVAEPSPMASLYCPPTGSPLPGELIPGDQFFSCQWALKNTGAAHQGSGTPEADIRATFAWPYTTGSQYIKLGIIDSGVDGNHVDFSGRVFGHTTDINGHGTHVAGIAAASANNPGGGTVGVDWNTSVHSRVASSALQATQALIDLVATGAHVINNSWGLSQFDAGLYTAFREAYENGRVLVTATTPTYAQDGLYPSSFGPWVLNVAAVNNNNVRATYSIPRRDVDVAAPGGEDGHLTGIISTLPNNNWGYMSGTSMAAPHVSGAATLMLAAEPNLLRNFDIEHILKRTARNWPNHSDGVGYGLIDVEAALERLQAPYTITHGNAQFNQFLDGQQQSFTVSPAPGLAAGTYFVDGYEFVASTSFSYQETPWAWLSLTDTGFDYANPNNAQRWMGETVTPQGMELRTVFYFIRSNLQGQQINLWVPFDPTPFPHQYTVLGIPGAPPLTASVWGSQAVIAGHTGYWTATSSGGSGGNRTFRWYIGSQSGTGFTLYRTHTTSQTEDNFSFQTQSGMTDFRVRVTVERGSDSAMDEMDVELTDTGGCPPPDIFCLVADAGPEDFELGGNHPNPFNPTTDIRYALPEAASVRMVVVDMLGREVARPVDGWIERGYHTTSIDGSAWASGVYLYRIEVMGESGEHFTATRRMTLLK